MDGERNHPFVTWLERVGPVADFEELHGHYLRTYGRAPLSRMRLAGRLRDVGITVDAAGRLVLPEDWPR